MSVSVADGRSSDLRSRRDGLAGNWVFSKHLSMEMVHSDVLFQKLFCGVKFWLAVETGGADKLEVGQLPDHRRI